VNVKPSNDESINAGGWLLDGVVTVPPAAGVLLTSEIPVATAVAGVEAGAAVELGFVAVLLQAQNSAVAARVAVSANLGM
jgi:hypothetical protein